MNSNYTTQMDAARKHILTREMEIVAKKERIDPDTLMSLVAEGKIAICANRRHTCIDPEGVGSMLRTKINVNLGVSRDCVDYDMEMERSNVPSTSARKRSWTCPATATRAPSVENSSRNALP